MQNKIKTYINFAVKAGQIIYGADALLQAKRVFLVLLENSLPLKTQNKIQHKFIEQKGCVLQVSAQDMFTLTNKQNVKAIGVTNESLAQAILQENKQSKLYAEVQ